MAKPPAAPKPSAASRAVARALRASLLVDRAAVWFDRLRSKLVVTLASDAVLDAYNAIAYGSSASYNPETDAFRRDWFPWERSALDAWFPAAPARVLVGGAGGGREALLLAQAGYEVTAFEPVLPLVRAFADAARGTCQVFVGRYETLPAVIRLDGTAAELAGDSFDAGIMGWGSVAHVRRDEARVEAVRAFARLVRGPVLVSVYPELWRPGKGRLDRWLSTDGAVFSPGLGRVQTYDEARLRDLLERAGVEILAIDTSSRIDNWPHAVVRASTGS
ncbi:MAG TPA: class I SAM-dependent methyltransferase [Vicinamibacterales bacterium]